MVGNQHITILPLYPLLAAYLWRASHPVQDNISPDISGQPEKLGIGFFRQGKHQQKRKENKNRQGDQHVKPDTV